jgi:serine/threonine-protein kinase
MSEDRWHRIEELFHQCATLPLDKRNRFLADACGDDTDLQRELESLLAQDDSHNNPIGRAVEEAVKQVSPEPTGSVTAIELTAGLEFGHYRIVEHLGTGGMGSVYKAADMTLVREVALKLLRPELLEDDDALARFEREARMLASLNHPHIASIYGFEEHNSHRFIAMEYVPGSTLGDRLRRGRLSIRDAMLTGKQIAEALEAAHAKSIIHRDLKPANIKLTEDGNVKVLDFGLARAIERPVPSVGEGTTTATELTGSMVVIGTAAYMSPEQASGRVLDRRTDIWSFGCVLYEALTARHAFIGSSITEILAAILEREPDWTALPGGIPAGLELLLRRCLRKDANSRLRDIGDARIELDELLTTPAQPDAVRGKPAAMTRRTAISALSGAVAGAAATGVFAISRYHGTVPRRLTQFAVMAPENRAFVPSFNRRVAISPDSMHIAFNAVGSVPGADVVHLRPLADLEPHRVKEIASGGAPFFSPDGRWLGIFGGGGTGALAGKPILQKLALSGGAPVNICSYDAPAGASWADGDTIYFVSEMPGGLLGVPAAGGQPKEAAKIDFTKGERQHKFPCALPRGKAVLFTSTTADTATFDDARIEAISPETGERKTVLEGGTHPRYSSGYLLYGRDGKILAVRFDAERLEVHGQPLTALEGVQMSRNTGAVNFDVSSSGDLAYISGICDGGARTLVWVDRNGHTEPVSLAPKSYLHPRLSPDDRRLAIEVEGPSHDLYIYDFDRGVFANITTDGVSHWPVWSPDGKQLAYRSGEMVHWRIWRVPADRSAAPQQVPATGVTQNAESWSPDGLTIAYTGAGPGVPPSIMVVHLHGSNQAVTVDRQKAPEGSPKFSPDGRWLAYCSNESGKPQVYVQSFPGPGPKIQVSNDGGTDPVWKRQGGELYYRNGDSMMAVVVATAAKFEAGRPQELWKGRFSHGMSSSCGPPGTTSSNYDVTADGKRFLMIKDDDQDRAASKQIVVVLGWAGELERMAARV